jgi:hypothetical protein
LYLRVTHTQFRDALVTDEQIEEEKHVVPGQDSNSQSVSDKKRGSISQRRVDSKDKEIAGTEDKYKNIQISVKQLKHNLHRANLHRTNPPLFKRVNDYVAKTDASAG